jgi:hypothetical protein
VIQEIELGTKSHYTKLAKSLNLAYKTRMLKIIKKRTEEFRAQQMDFKTDYHSMWFYANKNHHTGKFAGSDSRQGDIHNPIDAQQHHLQSAYINYMRSQFENKRDKMADKVIDTFGNQVEHLRKSNRREDVFGKTTTYIVPYLYHVNHKIRPNEYPILTMVDCNLTHMCAFEYQKLYGSELNTNWLIENYYNITPDNKFVVEVRINNKAIYSKSQDYTPLFYTGKEAIWFYWYGGNVNLDGGTHTSSRSDYYTDNVSTLTVWYPYYQDRKPSYFSPNNSDTDTNTDNWYEIYQLNHKKVMEHVDNLNKKVQSRILTTKLPKLLDELDMWYHTLISMLKLGNIHFVVDNTHITKDCVKSGSDFSRYETHYKYDHEDKLSFKTQIMTDKLCVNFSDGFYWFWLAISDTMDKFNARMLLPDTFINTTGIDTKLLNLIKESVPLITSRYSPSEKEKWTQEMNEILIKILEVSQNSPDSFASFDIMGFIRSVKKTWEEKVKSGTVKSGFKEHALTSLMLLTNGVVVSKALCI